MIVNNLSFEVFCKLTNLAKFGIQAFARCILPAIQAYFDTEAGRREFAEWQKQQSENKTA
jgi:hypothetical protein